MKEETKVQYRGRNLLEDKKEVAKERLCLVLGGSTSQGSRVWHLSIEASIREICRRVFLSRRESVFPS